ncbi:MAG: thiol peroxidase [Chitinispirillaceae bacterium]|jgi:thiol peroxidase|nr:thiol peroxidase [Chitinispirillaceae bacterium]
MAAITLHGTPIATNGTLPKKGSVAPDFTLTDGKLNDVHKAAYAGKKIVLNIFPSLDTPVCATSVRTFNKAAATLANTVVLCVSADLPFAHTRFCSIEGLTSVIPLSTFRHLGFGAAYGVTILDGALRGLLSRAIVVIDEKGIVIHTEQVPEIAQEPDYAAAIAAIK